MASKNGKIKSIRKESSARPSPLYPAHPHGSCRIPEALPDPTGCALHSRRHLHPTATTAHHAVTQPPARCLRSRSHGLASHGTAAACVRGATIGRRGMSCGRRSEGSVHSLVRITTSFLAIRRHLNREAGSRNACRVFFRHPAGYIFLFVPHTGRMDPPSSDAGAAIGHGARAVTGCPRSAGQGQLPPWRRSCWS